MGSVAAKPALLLDRSADSGDLVLTPAGFGLASAEPDPAVSLQPLIDALGQNIALLDGSGTIATVNAAWRAFAREHGWRSARAGIGTNYLRVCDASPEATDVAAELRALLAGRCSTSKLAYDMNVAGELRGFIVTMCALELGQRRWVLMMHGDAAPAATRGGAASVAPEQRLRIEFEERRRIARELHDSTSQHLTAIELLLMSAYRRVQDPHAERLIREAVQETVHALREMRSFSFLLHPPVVEGGGLAEAMASFIQGYSRRIELPITFAARIEAPESLVPFEAALFRVAQEALANVHRHADATCARVELLAGPDEVMIVVEDDGRGFGRDSDASGELPGVGIAAMKERVEEFGGNLEYHHPERGTRLTARIPLRGRRSA
jgi:signal transduction histidine kinase